MLNRRFTCQIHQLIHHCKPTFFNFFPLRTYRNKSPTGINSETYRKKSPTGINPEVIDYLTLSLGFSSPQALSLCQRTPRLKTLENPRSVVYFLKSLGFSDTQIRCSVNTAPQILNAHIDKTLKPKIKLFQDLGLQDYDLGEFFSKNSALLNSSLERRLIPGVDFLKKLLLSDKDLLLVINRGKRILGKDPEKVLKANSEYLMECGIVGKQLSMLLRRQPRLFLMKLGDLKKLVARAVYMGASVESKMFVYTIQTLYCMSNDTLMGKFQLFYEFGFSKVDCADMFRRMPNVFKTSHEKLKFGLSFFLNTAKLKKTVLVNHPFILMSSMENRVIPRHKVLEILMSKKLLKQQPSFIAVLYLSEDVFLDKFISKFPSYADELLAAYKGHLLESLEEKETESIT
ncbi:hypothetical protein DCAR_0310654 [Daucus carota subsp. sativus]|uniref:Uncharacterized protein n=1 Tax=Daucus carota subsp. sativus TaxID=79200 RepID=A0A166A2N0_DAUCS|nr:PREDICTED: uncharacterized protein LOC108211464 [Daucus carota subsp. sativus]WOG91405.1 hypothetical protein DCAR_0310654 [Daucus carota subsp. sativus]